MGSLTPLGAVDGDSPNSEPATLTGALVGRATVGLAVLRVGATGVALFVGVDAGDAEVFGVALGAPPVDAGGDCAGAVEGAIAGGRIFLEGADEAPPFAPPVGTRDATDTVEGGAVVPGTNVGRGEGAMRASQEALDGSRVVGPAFWGGRTLRVGDSVDHMVVAMGRRVGRGVAKPDGWPMASSF